MERFTPFRVVASEEYCGATMLKWIVILLVIALIAGALGYRGVASGAGKLAGILAVLALAGIVIVLLLFLWAGGGWV